MLTLNEITILILFFASLLILSPLLGKYIARVFNKGTSSSYPFLNRLEILVYKSIGCNYKEEMSWKKYLYSLLLFNALGILFLILLQIYQQYLPLNNSNLGKVEFFLALNTAISFVTNTNWQAYAGETTLSPFVQMCGLTVQNFLSAATGIAVFLVITRGIARKNENTIGNFWVDLTKSIIYILLPLSILLALINVSRGSIQSFSPNTEVTTLEMGKQVIPMGPVASQVAIKQLGTNGGGYFNANGAHPFENPDGISNLLQILAILLIPSALVFTYGYLTDNSKHSIIIFSVMALFLIVGLLFAIYGEKSTNHALGVAGNMEGKEVRICIVNSALWSTATTVASNGSVNSSLSSSSPIMGLIAIFNILLGEIIFGGVGSGMYGMILFILITVFLSGLMIGRTPEYLGKKIEGTEVKWLIVGILIPGLSVLIFSAVSFSTQIGLSSIMNKGPHGFSEILYAFSSAAGNNGSAFGGLNANTWFYNLLTGVAMLIGRYGVIVPVFAIAGSMVRKNKIPVSTGTMPTDDVTFGLILSAVILIVGALTFFPVLSLGPVLEHLLMNSGSIF